MIRTVLRSWILLYAYDKGQRDNRNGAGMVMRLFTDAGNDGLRKDSEICLRRVV